MICRAGRKEDRSRSVDVDQRNVVDNNVNTNNRANGVRKDRSLQDIDKDIETIWRELQQLDKANSSR